jgi:hypothetical protein
MMGPTGSLSIAKYHPFGECASNNRKSADRQRRLVDPVKAMAANAWFERYRPCLFPGASHSLAS